jgi:hypothetical protein
MFKYGSYNLDAMAGTDDTDPDGSRAWRAMRLSLYLNSHGTMRL